MLFKARWPNSFRCEKCDNDTTYCHIKSRRTFQCNRCKQQTSLKSNTLFHSSNVPLTKWFLAIHLITQNENGQSSVGLKRYFGVTYETAWRIKHKLMQAMAEKDSKQKLAGLIIIDEAYLGIKSSGKRGRGSENKQPFIAAVSLNAEGHPRNVKFSPVKSFTDPHWDMGKTSLIPKQHCCNRWLCQFQHYFKNQ